MAASVENMFYVRETPWHGLGKRVNEALNSKEALTAAGLNWNVIQEPIYTETEQMSEMQTVRYWALSQTAIRLCRIRRHLPLQMNC